MYLNSNEVKKEYFLISFTSGGLVHRKVWSEESFNFSEAYLRERDNCLNATGIQEIETKTEEETGLPDVVFIGLTRLGKGYKSDFELTKQQTSECSTIEDGSN